MSVPLSTVLETERLLLRPPRTRDIGRLQSLLRDNVAHLRPWSPRAKEGSNPTSLVEVASHITRQRSAWRDDRNYALFVEWKETERLVGRVALTEVVRGAFQNAYLGYWIDHRFVEKGVATEAVGSVVSFGFETLGLHRIQAAVMPKNVPSRRVLEKLGFREEGLARRYLAIAGEWEDHILYAKTADE